MTPRRAPVWLVLLAACGAPNAPTHRADNADHTETADDPADAEEPAMQTAPLPYTAEQIAAACAPGRTHVYLNVDAEGLETRQRTTFVAAEPGIAEFHSAPVDESGTPLGEPDVGRATWDELRQHAAFPAAQTTLSEVTIEVPAGTFDAVLYQVRGDDDSQTSAWFAPSLPGPPVRMRVEEANGALRWSMTLLSYEDPRATQ